MREYYLNPVFETVELPAGVADLNPGLADVDGDALSHGCFVGELRIWEKASAFELKSFLGGARRL